MTNAVCCERNIGGVRGDGSITKNAGGTGKVHGYCAVRDKEGEYLRLTPHENGWLIFKRTSKSEGSLSIDLDKMNVEKVAEQNGFEYFNLKNGGEYLSLSKVIDFEIGYPYGKNPFSI